MTRIGSIGVAKYIDWDVDASFYVSLALIKQNKSFNSKFLSQLIHSPNFQRQLWKRTIHVAFPKKINLGEIGKCVSILPIKLEQTKIANFLSSIDNKIEQVGKQLDESKQFKKALLQQMFV
jgi:type I restriction enzyme S subunit